MLAGGNRTNLDGLSNTFFLGWICTIDTQSLHNIS